MRFRHSMVIARPPDLVFAWIGDPERARLWQPDVAEGEILHAEPGMVGTRFREVLQDGRGRAEMQGRITEFRPGRSMAVRLEGHGMTVTARFEVSPHPRGTLLRADQSLVLPGRLAGVMQPLIRWRVAARARADLNRLRRLCEEAPDPRATHPGEES